MGNPLTFTPPVPSTTQAMLAPDGTPGEIPVERVQDALKSGFRMGVNLQAPTGQLGTVPVDQAENAVKSGFKPTSAVTAQQQMQYAASITDQIKQGLRESIPGQLAQTVGGAPQSAAEVAAHGAGGDAGLVAYRAAQGLVNAHKAMNSASGTDYWPAVKRFQDAAIDFILGRNGNAAANAVSGAASLAGQTNPEIAGPMSQAGTLARSTTPEGQAEGLSPITETTRGLTDLATLAATTKLPAAAESVAPEAADVADAAEVRAVAEPAGPSTFQKIIRGESVAQTPAKNALAEGAAASAEDAGVTAAASDASQGVRTLMDSPIAEASKAERAAYDTINEAAGTDMKTLYDSREELQDALDDPTNIANKKSLEAELKTTQSQIDEGEANVKSELGADADGLISEAKAQTQQRYAMQNAKAKIFNNESVVDGNLAHGDTAEEINVKSAIRQAENLNKPSKYAPEGSPTRLVQAFGEDGAKKLLDGLYASKRAGQSAVTAQKIALWVGGSIPTVGGAVYGIKRLLGK